ncbi:MAG: ABC transporter permease [Treponema sp.]|jgi:phospholipid/cholesterol/gamma-HCH transport system permease protein|nr:ABC transporter permease [Treponema sp.]
MAALFSGAFYTLGFFARTIKGVHYFVFHGKASHRVLVMQLLFTFVDALFLTALLALTIGAAVNIIGIPFLDSLGYGHMIYPLLIVIITRELGPLLAAFIIIARSATAIATEVAGMVISHEVEAYLSVGLDPIEHLAVPRFLGVTISMFLLNIYFSIFGLAGSYAVAQLFNTMSASVYFSHLLQNLALRDILMSLVKSISFGMIISIMAVMEGLAVERASTEVPVAGMRAVSNSFLWCIIADIGLSALFYLALL